MRLFVNSNNTNRGKRVALLQDKWSPAVGSSVCIKGKLCSALPPLPSARGSMSTLSLDPWRWLNTKLHRENVNALVGCYSAKPPLPLSHSTDTVSSPSAIVRTDRRMPLPVSAAHTREPTRDRLPVYFMDGTVEYHSADDSIVDCFFFFLLWWANDISLVVLTERVEAVYDVILLQPPKYLYGSAAALIGRSSQATAVQMASSTGLYVHTLLLY